MRKFKYWKTGVFIIYLLCAILLFFQLRSQKAKQSSAYRVEINRLCDQISNQVEAVSGRSLWEKAVKEVSKKSKGTWQYVREISYLSASEQDRADISDFYRTKNGLQMEMVPLFEEGSIHGYLRFDYHREFHHSTPFYWMGGMLVLWFLLTISIVYYMENRVIKPFQRLCRLPYELAKGNLSGVLEECKDRYFGNFIWGISMLRDKLKEHKKQELKLAKDKRMILLSISHDIKTPLNAISLYAKALEEDLYQSQEERKTAACQIQKEAGEIATSVKEIIRSSTEDVVVMEVHNQEFYLDTLVRKVQEEYGDTCRMGNQQFSVGNYENYLLFGDPDRLYEAVGNLMENAFKYGDGREIRLSFGVEDCFVLFSVYNSGNPVEDNDMAHLFDSFFRGKNAGGKEGIGLGLAICRAIMWKMDGDIFAKRWENGMEFVLVCRMSI